MTMSRRALRASRVALAICGLAAALPVLADEAPRGSPNLRPPLAPGQAPALQPVLPTVKAPAALPSPTPIQTHAHATTHKHGHAARRARLRAAGRSHLLSPPVGSVGAANAEARIEPGRSEFINAMQRFAWSEGALYQIYARPGQVTDIALEPGEQLVGSGPVAAGDTVRWIIGDTVSGTGASARVHILVKPVRADIETNLVINTNRRTYHLELRANPTVYMASATWTYPEDALIALRRAEAEQERSAPAASGLELARLNFGYVLSGDKPAWRPLRVFDDGRQTFVEFPQGIASGELPPLFVTGADGAAELVNYRVSGRYMVVDRLFENAQLLLGSGKHALKVRIAASGRRGA